MTKAYYYLVNGVVQGVGYRYFAYSKATRLGIRGYVKNLDNGDVEIYAWGSDDKLDEFEEGLKNGPSYSRVDTVRKSAAPIQPEFTNFEVHY